MSTDINTTIQDPLRSSEQSDKVTGDKRACPFCQSDVHPHQHPISRDPWKVVECDNCGFVYLQNPPQQDQLEDVYAWEKLNKIDKERRHPKGKKRLSSRIARLILYYVFEPIIPRLNIPTLLSKFAPAGDILDVGCGHGNRLEGIGSEYVPWGIEISKSLAREAREQFVKKGGDVVQASAIDGLHSLPENKFSAIVMRSYLEHEAFPREILRESYKVTNKGGILIIKVPNFGSINAKITGSKWCGVRLPAHVNYFKPQELKHIVTTAGYAIMKYNIFRYRLPTSDNIWMIAQKR